MVKTTATRTQQITLLRRQTHRHAIRRVVVAQRTLAAAEAASAAAEAELEAELLRPWTRLRRAVALALDDAATDAAVHVENAEAEVLAATAAAAAAWQQ